MCGRGLFLFVKGRWVREIQMKGFVVVKGKRDFSGIRYYPGFSGG